MRKEGEYVLHGSQEDYLNSQKAEVFLYAGRGFGKTFIESVDTYDCAAIGQTVQLLCAPTLDQLRGSTLKQVQECWYKLGYREGYHYVINEKPKDEWGVEQFSKLSNNRIISWINGSFIVCDSLENFDKHRGSEYDRITVDEFQNIDPDSRVVLLGCCRGKRMQELGLPIQIKYGLTPPKDANSFLYFTQLLGMLQNTDHADFFTGTSYENLENLPKNYIEVITAGLSPKDVQREILGQLVIDGAGKFVYSFDPDKHLKGVTLDENEPVHLAMDFNIGIMATTVWQFKNDWCYCVDEFEPEKGIDIIDRCNTIKTRYGHLIRSMLITGDPAKGQTGLRRNMNYYTSIQAELDIDDWQLEVKKSHPDSRDSRVLVNSMFSRYPDLKVHPRCSNLIKDLEYCTTDKDGKLDKTNADLTHYLDGMIYLFDYHFKGWYLDKK